MIIDGKKIAEGIINELKTLPKPKKFLAAVLVGEDPASVSFIAQKEKVAKTLDIDFRVYRFPMKVTQDELRGEILKIAKHKTCGGVIVQFPLPERVDKHYAVNTIPREKDVDVLGERALGAFFTGRNPVLPPAVGVVEKILRIMNYELEMKKVAVVGLGSLVGKPIATWLQGKCPELYLLDIGSDFGILKQADLVISGVGKANLIKPEMLKEDSLVIDFGYSSGEDGKLHGDFDFESLKTNHSKLKTIIYTPTPGGTGPVLVAQLFENFYVLCKSEEDRSPRKQKE